MKGLLVFLMLLLSSALIALPERPVYERDTALETITRLYTDGEWTPALARLHRYLRIIEESDSRTSPEKALYAYLMLGNIHLNFQNFSRADEYYAKGLQIAQSAGLRQYIFRVSGDLAVVNTALGNEKKARGYLALMRDAKGISPKDRELSILLTESYIERYFGDWKKSVSKLRHAMKLIPSEGAEGKRIVTPLSEITEMYEAHGMPDSALFFLKSYEEAARKYEIQSMMVDVQRLYTRVYIRLGDAERALIYQDLHSHMSDSLLNMKAYQKNVREFDEDQAIRTDNKIETMRFTISKQKNIIVLVGAIMVLILVFSLVIFYQKRRLHAAYLQLYDKNQRLFISNRDTGVTHDDLHSCHDNVTGKDEENETSSESTRPELRDKILKVMNESEAWCDPDFSLAELARLTESNSRYVSQAINEHFGKNFRSFINEYRIRQAIVRISDKERFGHITIAGIGESVGFRSRTNFIAAFKRETGLTPSVYMKINDGRRDHLSTSSPKYDQE